MLKGKTVVLGVSGGIAIYKACDIVSRLKKLNADVHVIMTKSSTEFIKPLTFQALSQNTVVTDMFEKIPKYNIEHISLAKSADLFLIAPATANIIGKISNGIADDMLSTTVMATKAPVLISPAMNTHMYNNIIVQSNIKKLKAFGYHFIAPESGRLACGDIGTGKLASPEVIVEFATHNLLSCHDFKGKNILITAGPTREAIDPIRFITNRSTGKMGYSIAKAAIYRGANVTLISGPVNIKPPVGLKHFISIESAKEMYEAVIDNLSKYDIIIKTAAVADYKPKYKSENKIKKTENNLFIELERNTDILKAIGMKKGNKILVGFAAETNNIINNAQSKLNKKNLDFIVLNDITKSGAGFGTDSNIITIIDKNGLMNNYPKMDKFEVSNVILDKIKNIMK